MGHSLVKRALLFVTFIVAAALVLSPGSGSAGTALAANLAKAAKISSPTFDAAKVDGLSAPGAASTQPAAMPLANDLVWAKRANMPTARSQLGVAVGSNGKIYAIGGSGTGYSDELATVEEYDSATNIWAARTSMPTARSGLGVVAGSNGKIYAIGGYQEYGGMVNLLSTVEEYDPATNSWMARTSMPTARYNLAVVAASNGKIYAIGGGNPYYSIYYDKVEEYNPATDTWATKTPMPTARYGLAAVAASNGKIYAIGGSGQYGRNDIPALVEEYDPATDTWAARTSMPTPRSGLRAVATNNGKVYAVGGYGCSYLATVEKYDPATDTWAAEASMPTARSYLGVVATSNGSIFAIGGSGPTGILATVEEASLQGLEIPIGVTIDGPTAVGVGTGHIYTASVAPTSATLPVTYVWEATGQFPVTHTNNLTDTVSFAWQTAGAKTVTVTASNGLGAVVDTHAVSVSDSGSGALAWTSKPDMPAARQWLGIAAGSNGKIYTFSGIGTDPCNPLIATVEEYDPTTNTWTAKASMSAARPGLAVATAGNGKIYAMGGYVNGTRSFPNSTYYVVQEYDPAINSWANVAGMPTARGDLGAAAANNGKVYAIGGANYYGGALNATEEYDPETNTWTTRAAMPTARYGLAVVAAGNGRIYALGGFNGSYLATVEEYDPATNSWTTRTSMPNPRAGLAAFAGNNGKVYAIGGSNGGGYIAAVEEYDPATNSWAGQASMPTARAWLGIAAAGNGKVYAIGGEGRTGTLARVEEVALPGGAIAPPAAPTGPFDLAWLTKGDVLTQRYSMGVARASNGKIYVIGGRGSGYETLAKVEEYDPATGSWATKANMPTARYNLGVVAASNGKIYAIGGAYDYNFVDTVEEYDPATNTWATKTSMPTARYGPGVVAAKNGKIYAIGGRNPWGYRLDTVEEYDPAANTWATKTSMSLVREDLGLVATSNGKIYAIGGQNNSAAPVAPVEEYDPAMNTWTTRASMPTPRSGLEAVEGSNGRIYAIGGNGPGGTLATVEEYDPATDTWSAKVGMSAARSEFGAVRASNGKIYAIGGQLWNTGALVPTIEEATIVTVGPPTGIAIGGPVAGTIQAPYLFTATLSVVTPSLTTYVWEATGQPTVTRTGILTDVVSYIWWEMATGPRTITVTATNAAGVVSSTHVINLSNLAPDALLWAIRRNMPTARAGLGVVAASNGKVYAIGGYADTYGMVNELSTVEEYDPATGTWSARARMPSWRANLGVVAASNSKIYAIGGGNAYYGSSYNNVEEYDPATDSWTTKASMPTARRSLGAAAASNGKIYAIGGTGQGGLTAPNALVEEYDPETNTWATKTSMPTARYGLAVVAASNGKIYAIGGYSSNSYLATVEEYDPETDAWATKVSMPSARSGLAAVRAGNGKIYAIGGYDGSRYYAKVEEYDPATNTWRAQTGMPTARRDVAAAVTGNGKIYVVGGHNGRSVVATVEEAILSDQLLANLIGRVTLQGRGDSPNAQWTVPLTVTLYATGVATPTYILYPTTDAEGRFAITGVRPGTYDVRVKKNHSLTNKRDSVQLSGGENYADLGMLLEGDATDNGVINSLDYAPLASAFFKQRGDTGYEGRVDFNDDGIVNAQDYSPLASNYFKRSG